MHLAQGGLILVRSTAVAIDGATDIRQTIFVPVLTPGPSAMVAPPESPTGSSSLVAAKPRPSADTSREIDAAFATFARERPDALFVAPDPIFPDLACPAGRAPCALSAVYGVRQFVEVGGLMSYGTSLPEMYHQVGVRAKPADFAGDSVNQVRTGHQRPDRPHAQPHCSSGRARHCRRGDRMTAYGTELPIRNVRSSVANGRRADNICSMRVLRILTRSGHQQS
jgi:hypothetical protein